MCQPLSIHQYGSTSNNCIKALSRMRQKMAPSGFCLLMLSLSMQHTVGAPLVSVFKCLFLKSHTAFSKIYQIGCRRNWYCSAQLVPSSLPQCLRSVAFTPERPLSSQLTMVQNAEYFTVQMILVGVFYATPRWSPLHGITPEDVFVCLLLHLCA